ncbi:MAG: tRNA (adenosine(37)-N6)-dimethylallyltransferase MiaA [Rhodospirillaceae bacterium]|nr:tRNA (adenosine(37)-N6)-dimethylallyltransferase MiaA [Rhodospirillaceae bacterium]
MSSPIIIVAGPTASGKSALALQLAEQFGGEIVNADSMQVYRELRVLTARPSAEDEARVPHHLYGVMSVAEVCSAGAWLEMALPCIDAIRRRGRLPVVCGGTGLYLKVLMEGIAPVPAVAPEIVEQAKQLYAEEGGELFRARLLEIDAAAERLAPADSQRLIRAYAVAKATGRTLAEWQQDQPTTPPLDARFLRIVLTPDRDALYARINKRFDTMVGLGALEEALAVAGMNLDPDLPALKALGVPDFQRYANGECELEEAVDKAKQLTRNFAKRQMTWFRHQLDADVAIQDFGAADAAPTSTAVRDFLRSPKAC